MMGLDTIHKHSDPSSTLRQSLKTSRMPADVLCFPKGAEKQLYVAEAVLRHRLPKHICYSLWE